jgi:hypothetical protein
MFLTEGMEVGDAFIFILSGPHLILHRTGKHCITVGSLLASNHGAHANANFNKIHCACPYLLFRLHACGHYCAACVMRLLVR